jgi:hypothetical protein
VIYEEEMSVHEEKLLNRKRSKPYDDNVDNEEKEEKKRRRIKKQ